jgi:hypothetical protein
MLCRGFQFYSKVAIPAVKATYQVSSQGLSPLSVRFLASIETHVYGYEMHKSINRCVLQYEMTLECEASAIGHNISLRQSQRHKYFVIQINAPWDQNRAGKPVEH